MNLAFTLKNHYLPTKLEEMGLRAKRLVRVYTSLPVGVTYFGSVRRSVLSLKITNQRVLFLPETLTSSLLGTGN